MTARDEVKTADGSVDASSDADASAAMIISPSDDVVAIVPDNNTTGRASEEEDEDDDDDEGSSVKRFKPTAEDTDEQTITCTDAYCAPCYELA
jgi:hypothetical protein